MSDFQTPSTIHVTAPFMASDVTSVELARLGFKTFNEKPNAVELTGTLDDCMRLNLQLRTASRVLFMLDEFQAQDAEQLYEKVNAYEWEKWIDVNGYFSVQSYTHNASINNTLFTNLKVKDAVADRFMQKFNKRPDSGPSKEGVIIFLHWVESNVSLYLDTSGDSLARHGYRKIPLQAPLQENLAAAMVLSTNWERDTQHFVNPMCGSGTLAIEAALYKTRKPPGLIKKDHAFRYIKGYDDTQWEQLVIAAEDKVPTKPFGGRIIATDISRDAVNAAKINAKLAGVDH
ncbi:MAG TPA: THUMP domain-containing protein, partial [Chitinophagales bacterium]|nr:THUMP domain-containing protein [Chitinophagales bacterium]